MKNKKHLKDDLCFQLCTLFWRTKKLNIEMNFPNKCTINVTHNFMNFWSVPIMALGNKAYTHGYLSLAVTVHE